MKKQDMDEDNTASGHVRPYREASPRIAPTAFVAPGAVIVGDVDIGPDSGVWYGCIIRADVNAVRIGARTNIQDGTIIHESRLYPTRIGDDVTIGHMAVIHACTLGDGCFIGMKAMVMDGAVVEPGGLLAAGAMLTPGKVLPQGQLWAGSPARYVRDLNEQDRAMMAYTAPHYVKLAREYAHAYEYGHENAG